MLSWQVVKLDESSGWAVQCITFWKDSESFQKAMGESEDIVADAANYTTVKPTLLLGGVVGESPKA